MTILETTLDPHRITEGDLYLFNEGTHFRLWEKLGAHPGREDGRDGVLFAVWAPNAERVSVVGDFNGWEPGAAPLEARAGSGVWDGFVEEAREGHRYKFHIVSRYREYTVEKSDPFARYSEVPPGTASIVRTLDLAWGDDDWMEARAARQAMDAPISIYEMHLGSWRHAEDEHRSLSYREVAPRLIDHLQTHGFTHVELMPIMEHPFYGSWGYQTTGYFAPTSRFGPPEDFAHLVDQLHRAGIGVILDWVPSHFPSDEAALGYFDGTHLFEHADPRKGFHPDWRSLIFNYGRREVQAFLVSSAMYWLDVFHVDGLRVDAVASMLYLDYSRREGEWIPNESGGRENTEAVDFLCRLNGEIERRFPDTLTIAEESTAWPRVSAPTDEGGLGFDGKWDMGWMHDVLSHLRRDPAHRRYHYGELTFRAMYQFSERYVLALSHDEVVHGKGSLVNKMAGDDWQRFANLRLLYAHQWTQPGKKLLFMGQEFAQHAEWNQDTQLDWSVAERPRHAAVLRLVRALNRLYADTPALHELDWDPSGFRWIEADDAERGVLAYLRHGKDPSDVVLVVLHTTPVPLHDYTFGVPRGGPWRVLLDTDAVEFGGSGAARATRVRSHPLPRHGFDASISLTLPPLGALVLAPVLDSDDVLAEDWM